MINEDALTAVSLAFPVQSLMIAVGTGTGVGINALLSKSLGEKKFDVANKTADNGIFLSLLSFLAFAIIGGLFSRPFFAVQTSSEQIIGFGTSYLTICCVCSFGIYFQLVFEKLLQSTGKTFYTMITQGTGAIINIIPVSYTHLKASSLIMATKTLSTMLYNACTSMEIIMGSDMESKSRLTGIIPILFSFGFSVI